ncbi:hypothetical protein [Pseudolysinimonas sp.]|uniref:hypothetical protein n=1 Tax=Pseudolysinimonas sp. TaxID=2680009 RepID=UPI003F7EFC17
MSETDPVEDIERMGPGSTVIASVFALVIGGVVGLLATFAHAQWAPWGLVAGLAILVCLVAGFRLVFASRIVAAAAAVGFVVAGALLALPGAGAPILRLDGPAGWIWAVAPVVLAVVVLAVPWRGRASARA